MHRIAALRDSQWLHRWILSRGVLHPKWLYLLLLVALPFAIYSNGYRHEYQLDDGYTLVSNPHVRSLSEVPRYFVDPSTYSSLRAQVDYRPVLQATYALNYAMGGYDVRWWHFTQILLHVIATVGIFALCRRILTMLGDPRPDRIAAFAAVVFAIHPASSGVVNYLNARSSLLTAAFLLPALLLYMKRPDDDRYEAPAWAAAALYSLALFTKVEAVGALGAFLAYDLWRRGIESPRDGLAASLRKTFDSRTLRRLAPALGITAVYFLIRWKVMSPYPFDESRHAADVGAYQYFVTQVTAWWHYIFRWLAPVRLVADDLTYPVYRSWLEPRVLLALGGWVAVAALLASAWRRAPYLVFLAIASLALLSPTSSFAPLAEMVNEHRPYLPIGILSLALVIPAGQMLRLWPVGRTRLVLAGGIAIVLVALSAMTYCRNEVFLTEASYWKDVLAKAPSARAHLNYGRALMAGNDMDGAVPHFQQALQLAPYWYITHVNLAIAHQRLGQVDRTRMHHDRAVEYDKYDGLALNRRGEFLLAQGDYEAAHADFVRSSAVGLERYRNTRGLATAFAGMGDVARSLEQTERLIALDSAAALFDIPGISMPFFSRPGLQMAGVEFYRRLDARLPGTSWIPENIARLTRAAGRQTK